jgi:hypothetical protein
MAWMRARVRPGAPPTAGSRGEWKDVGDEFDRRAKVRFPIGIPVGQMETELRRKGFSRNDWICSIDRKHKARRREDIGIRNRSADGDWRADDEGRPTAVRGVYRQEGCL